MTSAAPPRPPTRQPPLHMPFPQQQVPPPTRASFNSVPQPQYQPFPQQLHYTIPPPPPEDHAHAHSYAQQQLQHGDRGPAYGHFQPSHQGPQAVNERVKVIKGSGPPRRDSVDSDGANGPLVRKEKKRKIAGSDTNKDRLAKFFVETRERLNIMTRTLHANPSDLPEYSIKLYPASLKRAALLSQTELEEEWSLESAQSTFDEEKAKIEDEWKKGKERIRERLLEGLEERRKKAREEMASDGVLADAPTFEPPTIIRASSKSSKPPPFVLAAPHPFGAAGEEMVSPFPLPLTAYGGGTGAWGANGRKRQKGVGPGGGLQLGKAIPALAALKDSEVDADTMELKKAMKRKRRGGQGIAAGQYRD